ncbi:hypothetical protein ACH4TX_39220 [Streptomyces sp. NPDC021098]|uniref:hypothetical protein n=1 Tax=unclassified Streptomyces TaxID=2593676 RepID=UPI0037A9F1D9
MSGTEPYAGHDPIAVLLLSLVGVTATLWLAVRGIRLLAGVRTPMSMGARIKALATMAWAAAVGMYTWGVLHLFFLDETGQSQACNAAIGTERLTGYAPSFIPLRFGCRTSEGHTVEAVIPSYINAAAALLGVCAVTLTVFAIAQLKEEKK